MGFSSYGLQKLRNDLNRKKVYKEKLRKLYKVEYEKRESGKVIKVVPEQRVKKTNEKLKREEPERKIQRITKNILYLLLSLLLTWSLVYLLQFILFESI
jgi:hypothetical protein